MRTMRPARSCCDLLSFHYLCAIRNSTGGYPPGKSDVVICFHFIIFVLLETAIFFDTDCEEML